MKSNFWLDQVPLWGVLLFTVFLVWFSMALGLFLGRRKRRLEQEADTVMGTIIAASLGLLGFMLAITFGTTAQFMQIRRQLLLDEVNAIGTAYHRAQLLAEPHQSDLRLLLREYVDVRLKIAGEDPARDSVKLREQIAYLEGLLDLMWRHAADMRRTGQNAELEALFISSLNEVIDLQNSRVTTFQYRLPAAIWYVLFLIAALSMVMVGYQLGRSGQSRTHMEFLLVLNFAAVVLLIADLDRVAEGWFKISGRPMARLYEQMQQNDENMRSAPLERGDQGSRR